MLYQLSYTRVWPENSGPREASQGRPGGRGPNHRAPRGARLQWAYRTL